MLSEIIRTKVKRILARRRECQRRRLLRAVLQRDDAIDDAIELCQDAKRSLLLGNYAASQESMNCVTDCLVTMRDWQND